MKSEKLQKRICPTCKRSFDPEPDNPGQKYCTTKCWREHLIGGGNGANT